MPKETWNNRVVRRTYPHEVVYAIHEVHYTDYVPHSVTVDPVPVAGESVDQLRNTLERMLRALDKPVLDYHEDFKSPEGSE
jgi:CBS-domain-containing membrane protein